MSVSLALPLILSGMSVTSDVTRVVGEREKAREKQRYVNEYSEARANLQLQTAIAQRKAFNTSVQRLARRYNQEQEVISWDLMESMLENKRRKATASVSAAESGVSGVSYKDLMREYEKADAINQYKASKNLEGMGLNFDDSVDNLKTRAINAVNNVWQYEPVKIPEPSMAGNTLLGLSKAVQTFNSGYSMSKEFPRTTNKV